MKECVILKNDWSESINVPDREDVLVPVSCEGMELRVGITDGVVTIYRLTDGEY